MTYTNRNSRNAGSGDGERNPPTHVAKVRSGSGNRASYERIGVAWESEDGSLYVRLYGTQIVSGGFALYPIDEAQGQGGGQ